MRVGVKQLLVSLQFDQTEIEVGELVYNDGKIYFKYYSNFINHRLDISPFHLPFSNDILTPNTQAFDGLFGVFNDSLPDGWGRLLLDRSLQSKGIPLYEVTPLDRLAFVGSSGQGALVYKPKIENETLNHTPLQLDLIANQVQEIINGTSDEVIEELFKLGGSSGGARPKILVGYNPTTDEIIHGTEELPDGYEHWIIKYPSSTDPIDIANIEYAYYQMALDAGIEMSDCKLFYGVSGKAYFGTKRFDRAPDARLHMHSASGLMHDDFRRSQLDYGMIMDAAFRLENHVVAYQKVMRRAAFNLFLHNRDDHSKNFAFLMNAKGEWSLSPAYDLTFSSSSHGQHSTTIAGEGILPGKKHLMELAHHFSVKDTEIIIEQVIDVAKQWSQYAKSHNVGSASIRRVESSLNKIRH